MTAESLGTPPPAFRPKRHRFLHGAAIVAGVTFAGLTTWSRRLPVLHGSMWSLKDTLVKAGAIVSGVLFLLFVLASLLPWFLDRLEGRTFTSFVGARHVRSPKSGFLTVISVLSICGVSLSSCALSSVVSVMGGFSQDLKRKLIGNNAHITIDMESAAPWQDYEKVLDAVRLVPGVTAATPVVQSEVMVSSPSNLAGVIVRGIDPGTIGNVVELPKDIEVGKLEYIEKPEELLHLPAEEVIGIGPGGEQYLRGAELAPDDLDPSIKTALGSGPLRPGIIVGRELAKTLHVYVGDEVTLVSPMGDIGPMGVMPRTKKFRVAAIFFSGMYEFDASDVYITIDEAQRYFGIGDKVMKIDVKSEDPDRVEPVTTRVTETSAEIHPGLRVRDWRELNKNLFSALKLERFATFIILSIAILVASFCIICTLLLMVSEKGKEIAILKAIGASDQAILRTFMTEGVIIGAIGTVFGVATGLGLCTGLSLFGLRLDPDVYYIDRLPIAVNGWDFFTVAISSLTICTLATLYPAHAASTLRPVEGLRYE
ncbi:MAG TPA: ABC transporter permease [Polyangiaceae bacterium]|jgi:lipoprotein-releasing system permease protein